MESKHKLMPLCTSNLTHCHIDRFMRCPLPLQDSVNTDTNNKTKRLLRKQLLIIGEFSIK